MDGWKTKTWMAGRYCCNRVTFREWMTATASRTKTPYIKEWIAQANPPKEASMLEKIDGLPQFLS